MLLNPGKTAGIPSSRPICCSMSADNWPLCHLQGQGTISMPRIYRFVLAAGVLPPEVKIHVYLGYLHYTVVYTSYYSVVYFK